jgi:hypothetical protein
LRGEQCTVEVGAQHAPPGRKRKIGDRAKIAAWVCFHVLSLATSSRAAQHARSGQCLQGRNAKPSTLLVQPRHRRQTDARRGAGDQRNPIRISE